MLDPYLLKTFLAAAAGPSFRQAAATCNLAPSTVTSQIKALEQELGLPLFERAGGRTALTEHGRRLVRHAHRLLDLEAETRRLLAGGDDASLELTVRLSESLGLALAPLILPLFRQRFAHTRLVLATHSRAGLARDLRQGGVDLALLLGEPFAAEGVTMEELHREPLVVIAPPGSSLADRKTAGPADLDGWPLLSTRHVWSARQRIEDALARAEAQIAGHVECTSLEIVKRCVAAGAGLAVAPWLAVRQEVAEGRLAALAWAEEPLSAPVLLLRACDREPCPAGAAFIAATRAALALLPEKA